MSTGPPWLPSTRTSKWLTLASGSDCCRPVLFFLVLLDAVVGADAEHNNDADDDAHDADDDEIDADTAHASIDACLSLFGVAFGVI